MGGSDRLQVEMGALEGKIALITGGVASDAGRGINGAAINVDGGEVQL